MFEATLQELVNKTGEFVPSRGQWQVSYLGFAREGWTNAAQTFADDFAHMNAPEKANWRPAGMKLIDLHQVNMDLRDWVRR